MSSRFVTALLLALVLAAQPRPAAAGLPEIRLWLARLMESLDAGLGPAELRQLRVEINAEIRVFRLTSFTPMADLEEVTKALAAAHQGWTLLLGLPACQPAEAGAAPRDPAACGTALAPHLRDLKLPAPNLAQPLAPATVLQPMLQSLRRVAERTLRDLR